MNAVMAAAPVFMIIRVTTHKFKVKVNRHTLRESSSVILPLFSVGICS